MRSLNQCIVVVFLLAGSIAGYGQNGLSGKWRGTEKNLPVVDLTIEQNAGQATGSAIFYLIKSNSDGSNRHVDGQANGPMEHMTSQPERLSFDMHRPDGSVVNFRVVLTDANHAKLFRIGDDVPGGTGLLLVRINP
jgi:hypothetical protein